MKLFAVLGLAALAAVAAEGAQNTYSGKFFGDLFPSNTISINTLDTNSAGVGDAPVWNGTTIIWAPAGGGATNVFLGGTNWIIIHTNLAGSIYSVEADTNAIAGVAQFFSAQVTNAGTANLNILGNAATATTATSAINATGTGSAASTNESRVVNIANTLSKFRGREVRIDGSSSVGGLVMYDITNDQTNRLWYQSGIWSFDNTNWVLAGGFFEPSTGSKLDENGVFWGDAGGLTNLLNTGISGSGAIAGQVLAYDGSGVVWTTPAGGGNISSSGSPVNHQVALFSSGTTITGTAADTTTTHALFATATDPAFRAILSSDIPALNYDAIGAATAVTNSGTANLNILGNAATATTATTAVNATAGGSAMATNDSRAIRLTSSGNVISGNFSGNFTNGSFTAGTALVSDSGKGIASLANGGSHTLLHGASPPSYSAVSLSLDVSGNLPVGNLDSGTAAALGMFWGGDGHWDQVQSSNIANSLLVVSNVSSPFQLTLQTSSPLENTNGFISKGSTGFTGNGAGVTNVNGGTFGFGSAPAVTLDARIDVAQGINTNTGDVYIYYNGAWH